MTKKRIAELYGFLSVASMKRLTDDEKAAFIRLLRMMKPVANEIQTAVNDAVAKAREACESEQEVLALVNKSMEDLANAPTDLIVKTMTADMFNRLCLSNDWTFAQIDELEQELVTS